MRVELLQPDTAMPLSQAPALQPAQPDAFAHALDSLGGMLERATRAEDVFAHGAGSLQDAVYERARADVAIAVATAAAQRGAQAVNAIMNMQM